jgi:hypothetical protein
MEEPQEAGARSADQPGDSKRQISCVIDRDSRHTVEFNGWWYAEEDIAEVRRRFDEGQVRYRNYLRKTWAESPQGKLCLELYDKFMEYKKFLDEHPYVPGARFGVDVEYPEHQLLKETLVRVSDYQQARAEKDCTCAWKSCRP